MMKFCLTALVVFCAVGSVLAQPMLVGVDDAGRSKPIYDDPAMTAAFRDMGLDFLMFHIRRSHDVATVDRLDRWAREQKVGFYINQENADKPAGDPALYEHARLILLCGVTIPPETFETIRRRTAAGCVTVALPWLLPSSDTDTAKEPYSETPLGQGTWIVTDSYLRPELRERLAPLLGQPDQLRYVFGRTEVIFRPDGAGLAVETRELPD